MPNLLKTPRDIAIEARRLMIAKWMLEGVTSQTELRKRAGVSPPVINRDVKAIRQEWRQDMVEMFDHAKEEQLKRIDKVEEQAWKAWNRSCKLEQKIKRVKTATGKVRLLLDGEPEPTESGEPKFLVIVRNCCEDRRKLLGLDEPEKIDIRGTIGVANLELQKTIEGNGDYIEYRRQLALSASTGQSVITVLPSNGDQQREVETSQAPYVVGYPSSANGNGKAIATPTKTNRPRPRFD